MLLRWEELEGFVREEAGADLRATGEVGPSLVAFDGDVPLLLAYLRPFPKGQYADPLIELIALACPLGANRLAVVMGGRAWSLDDPIVPVLPEEDLRQRVLTVHGADGTVDPPRSFGVLWPFELTETGLTWGEPSRTDSAEGWIPQALAVAVANRDAIRLADGEVARQASRCIGLGHDLYLAPAVADRLGATR